MRLCEGEQAHQRHHRTHDAGRGCEDRAGDDGRHRERPGHARGSEVQAVEQPIEPALAPIDDPDLGLVVHRTLRSGQTLRHPGSIAVIGDVNPGAEIVAGGDIVVWGRLRGVVHAGAMGDEKAVVCALDLSPTQVRIANYLSRSPDDKRKRAIPEVAHVRDGKIVAESWEAK